MTSQRGCISVHLAKQICDAAVHFLLTVYAVFSFLPTFTVLVSSFFHIWHIIIFIALLTMFNCCNNNINTYNGHNKFTVHWNNNDIILLRLYFSQLKTHCSRSQTGVCHMSSEVKEGFSAIVLWGVFMTGPSIDPLTLADWRARLSFAQVTFFPLPAKQTGFNLIQVVTSRTELGLQEADVCLIATFLQTEENKD